LNSAEIKILSNTVVFNGHDDGYLNHVAKGGEDQLIKFVTKYIEPNSIILDIGANIGVTSAIFGLLAKESQIYSLEPGPKNFDFLTSNMRDNQLTNVKAFRLGAGNENRDMSFNENSAWGFIDEYSEHRASSTIVPVVTLDSFVARERIERVDFVKIDVEGFEPQVLQGMKKIIDEFNPKILFEFNSFAMLAFGGNNPFEFLEWINNNFKNKFVLSVNPNNPEICETINPIDFAIKSLHRNIVSNGSVDNYFVFN